MYNAMVRKNPKFKRSNVPILFIQKLNVWLQEKLWTNLTVTTSSTSKLEKEWTIAI